jgi:hypothetical protein
MNTLKIKLILLLLPLAISGFAQTVIWQEDFDGLPDQTTVDNGATKWSVNQGSLRFPNFTNGTYFGVFDGTFLARNLHDASINGNQASSNTTLTTEEIDISGENNIFIFVEGYSSFVGGSGSFETTDFVQFSYSLNGAPFTLFANNGDVNDDFVIIISSSDCGNTGLSGNTLRIRIRFSNSSVGEYYRVDNIKVVSDPFRPDPADFDYVSTGNGDWNNTNTWNTSGVPDSNDDVLVECNAIVRLKQNSHQAQNITINSGGALIYEQNGATMTLSANGTITIRDGALFRNGSATTGTQYSNVALNMSGASTIYNSSFYNQTGRININGNNSSVTLTGKGEIEASEISYNDDNQHFINRSTLILTNRLTGNGDNKAFTNDQNATLNFTGQNFFNNRNVDFRADAVSNAVWYHAEGDQNIYRATAGYHHLVIAASGVKRTTNGNFAGQSLLVNGSLLIRDDARLDLANDIGLVLGGDFYNSSSHSDGFRERSANVTFNGSGDQTIYRAAGAETFSDFTINKPAGSLLLSSEVIVSGHADFVAGIVSTSPTNILHFQNNATSNGGNANSYASGPVRKAGNDAFVFPIGKNGKWARLGISAPNTTSTQYTAEYFNNSYATTDVTGDLVRVSNIEYWDLDQAVNDDDVQVTLYWEDRDYSGIQNSSDLLVAHYNSGLSAWESVGVAQVQWGASGSITSGIVNNFSPFTFGTNSDNNTLPIQLLYIEARNDAGDVLLEWKTASEINNDYFSIERSTDLVHFETVAEVDGAGTSLQPLLYQWHDRQAPAGKVYYRLRQTDYDGTSTLSKVVGLVTQADAVSVGLVEQESRLVVNGLTPGADATVVLMGLHGRVWQQANLRSDATGAVSLSISSIGLSRGVYIARIQTDKSVHAQRIFLP